MINGERPLHHPRAPKPLPAVQHARVKRRRVNYMKHAAEPPPAPGEVSMFDGPIHLLCSCKHDLVSNLRCARHQKAVRRILMEIMRSVTGYDTVLVDLKEEDRDLHQMMDELEDSDDEADANTEIRPEIPTPTEREEAAEAAANAAPQKEEWEGAEEEAAHSEYREFIEESDCEITDDEDPDYTPHPEEDTESDSDSDSEMPEIDTVTPSDQASPSTSTARTRSAKAGYFLDNSA